MRISPTNIFRIDGIGATITAICLGVLMPQFPELFHLPKETLVWLAAIACAFSGYSLSCSVLKPIKWRGFMIGIAVANISYCVLTAWLVLKAYNQLGLLDLAYFGGEMIIVLSLASFEVKVALTDDHNSMS